MHGKGNDMTITLVASCLAVLVASMLGGIVPLATVLNHIRLQVYLSFSAGTMLGAAFFHMLPEAVRIGSATTIPWAAAGLLALFFLERFLSFHHHGRQTVKLMLTTQVTTTTSPSASQTTRKRVHPPRNPSRTGDAFKWPSAAFGLAIHSLVGGVAVRSAVVADFEEHARWALRDSVCCSRPWCRKPANALHDLDTHAQRRIGPLARSSHQFRLRPDDPCGCGNVCHRVVGIHARDGGDGHGWSARILCGNVPVHCAF